MKHLLLLIVIIVGGYVAWNIADQKVRDSTLTEITRHGLRLGALAILLLLLVAAAVYFPASNLF